MRISDWSSDVCSSDLWTDIQVQANRVSDSVQFATNIGGAHSRGFEFEITAVPTSGLTIGINGSINDAKVTKLTPQEAAISGAVLRARLASPHFQGSAYARYALDLGKDRKSTRLNSSH